LAKNTKREIIKLLSSAKTGYFYTVYKNKANSVNKLIKRKYDPIVKKHILFKETKIK
jgi:large subunit ribosomal protein L33